MAKRTMTHHGRGKGKKAYSAKHNDRNTKDEAEHIDASLTSKNPKWNHSETAKTFEDGELEFYEKMFGEQLKATNEKYIKSRHTERVKTMAEWKVIKQNAPEESIYQIGKMHDDKGNKIDDWIRMPELLKVYNEFRKFQTDWSRQHGNCYTVLNLAGHVDEPNCPDHIHERKVWHYKDKNGNWKIGQEKALEAAGIELPDPKKPIGRYNNRKMTYDAIMREKWLDICQSHGIEVERTPLPGRKPSKDKEEYVRTKFEQLEAKNNELEKQLEEKDQQLQEATQKATEATKRAEEAERAVNTLQAQKQALEAEIKGKKQTSAKLDKMINAQVDLHKKNEIAMANNNRKLNEQERLLEFIDSELEYQRSAEDLHVTIDAAERRLDALPNSVRIFKDREAREFIANFKADLKIIMDGLLAGINRLKSYEHYKQPSELLSKPIEERKSALDDRISEVSENMPTRPKGHTKQATHER